MHLQDVNPYILRMLKDTFSPGTAHLYKTKTSDQSEAEKQNGPGLWFLHITELVLFSILRIQVPIKVLLTLDTLKVILPVLYISDKVF